MTGLPWIRGSVMRSQSTWIFIHDIDLNNMVLGFWVSYIKYGMLSRILRAAISLPIREEPSQ